MIHIVLPVILTAGALWIIRQEFKPRGERLRPLGQFHASHGDYTGAEALYRQALAIDEKRFGKHYPDVATDLECLAELYEVQGKRAEAVPLYTRALGIWEQTLGPDHPDVAIKQNNLAVLYHDEGEYGEAETLFLRSIAAYEKVGSWEPIAPGFAIVLSNLAALYEDRGACASAVPLYEHALPIREKFYGPNHPEVAQALNSLAWAYEEQGDDDQAEPLYARALAIWEQALEVDHPAVTRSLNTLPRPHRGQVKDADNLEPGRQDSGPKGRWECGCGVTNPSGRKRCRGCRLEHAEAIKRTQWARHGIDHPSLSAGVSVRSSIPWKWIFAIYALIVVLVALEDMAPTPQSMATQHPVLDRTTVERNLSTWVELNERARVLLRDGRLSEGTKVAKEVLEHAEKEFTSHPYVIAISLNNLGLFYRVQGKYASAEPLYKRAVAILEEVYGPEHDKVAVAIHRLAELYQAQGKSAEADALHRRVLEIRERPWDQMISM